MGTKTKIFLGILIAAGLAVGTYFFTSGEFFKGFIGQETAFDKLIQNIEFTAETPEAQKRLYEDLREQWRDNLEINTGETLSFKVVGDEPVAIWMDDMEIKESTENQIQYMSRFGTLTHTTADKIAKPSEDLDFAIPLGNTTGTYDPETGIFDFNINTSLNINKGTMVLSDNYELWPLVRISGKCASRDFYEPIEKLDGIYENESVPVNFEGRITCEELVGLNEPINVDVIFGYFQKNIESPEKSESIKSSELLTFQVLPEGMTEAPVPQVDVPSEDLQWEVLNPVISGTFNAGTNEWTASGSAQIDITQGILVINDNFKINSLIQSGIHDLNTQVIDINPGVYTADTDPIIVNYSFQGTNELASNPNLKFILRLDMFDGESHFILGAKGPYEFTLENTDPESPQAQILLASDIADKIILNKGDLIEFQAGNVEKQNVLHLEIGKETFDFDIVSAEDEVNDLEVEFDSAWTIEHRDVSNRPVVYFEGTYTPQVVMGELEISTYRHLCMNLTDPDNVSTVSTLRMDFDTYTPSSQIAEQSHRFYVSDWSVGTYTIQYGYCQLDEQGNKSIIQTFGEPVEVEVPVREGVTPPGDELPSDINLELNEGELTGTYDPATGVVNFDINASVEATEGTVVINDDYKLYARMHLNENCSVTTSDVGIIEGTYTSSSEPISVDYTRQITCHNLIGIRAPQTFQFSIIYYRIERGQIFEITKTSGINFEVLPVASAGGDNPPVGGTPGGSGSSGGGGNSGGGSSGGGSPVIGGGAIPSDEDDLTEEIIVDEVDTLAPLSCWEIIAPPTFKDVFDGETATIIETIASIKTNRGPIVVGFDDGTFRPNKDITRAEFGKMLLYATCIDQNSTKKPDYEDVDNDDWFYRTVKDLLNLDVATGYEDGTFRPKDSISRAEAATMIMRLYRLQDPDFEESEYRNDVYADGVDGKYWSVPAVTLFDLGIMKGSLNDEGDYIFEPKRDITRAETAIIVSNLLARLQSIQ